MKIGVVREFYFDFLVFLKEKGFFKDNKILIYKFENFNELEICLRANLIDIALSSNSLLFEREDEFGEIVFIKKAFKIFGTQNFRNKLLEKNEIIKVAVPQKTLPFKKYFFNFYRFFYGKSEKIQWLQLTDFELDILFENNYIDFAIVFEPLTFKIINQRIASLLVHKNRYEIPLSFIYNKEKIEITKLNDFYSSILDIRKSLIEENLLEEFLSFNNNQYLYLKTYSSIFLQSFYIDKYTDDNLSNMANDFDKKKKKNQIEKEKSFFTDELINNIKYEINRLIQYGTGQISDCNVGTIYEIQVLKSLIENLKNKDKLNLLKISAIKNKNLLLKEDLENKQQSLSDIFMQFRATSENLIIKNIQVQESIKEKDRLIAIISHDLKTPLSGILAISQQLLEVETDEEKRKKLNIILESGNHLFMLINNLLEKSKDISNSKKLDEKIFDISKLIESIVANIKEKIKEKDVEFKFYYDDTIPKILLGDSLKLNQILYNLLGNSIKFTSHGCIELKIQNIGKDSNTCKLLIQVSDTGIGISQDKIDHIFDPFVQEDEKIKEKYGGTGLGLSIVKDYIELMGGNINVESEKNKGTKFSIILNFNLPKEKLGEKIIENIHKYIVFKDSDILILEDNLINQEVIKGYLSNYKSLNLTFRQNGQEGLTELKNKKYDLVLSDILMPVMDGKEFCINLRKFDKSTPVIALTAFDRDEEVDELKKIGFNYLISKPYNKEELINGISKYIPIKEFDQSESKLFDLAEKAKNSDKIDKFKKLFLEDLINRYNELKIGLENKDKEKLRFFCHNLKGTAPTFGYSQFAKLAEIASALYKEDKWEELEKIREDFLKNVNNIYDELDS
ncbi:MAG: ATP-binding protein [Exilispira sp.]|jgi:signal transduction histidine kinase/DNA-binding response OmpR family regulator|nr:ATP-binding protein [Exilispira sp.]